MFTVILTLDFEISDSVPRKKSRNGTAAMLLNMVFYNSTILYLFLLFI